MKLRMLFLALMFSSRLVYASQDCQICNNTADMIEISKRGFDTWSAETVRKIELFKVKYFTFKENEIKKFPSNMNMEEEVKVRAPSGADYHYSIISSGEKKYCEIESTTIFSIFDEYKSTKMSSDGELTYQLEYRKLLNDQRKLPPEVQKSIESRATVAIVYPGPTTTIEGDPILNTYTIRSVFWHNQESFYSPVESFLRGETRAGNVIYGGTENIDGVNCQRFEASGNDSVKVTVWISPEHNHGIKKAEIITPLEQSTIFNTYEQVGDITFLKESRTEYHDINTSEKLQAYLFQTLDFKILEQEDVDDEIFVLKFPEDLYVYRFDLEGDRIPLR